MGGKQRNITSGKHSVPYLTGSWSEKDETAEKAIFPMIGKLEHGLYSTVSILAVLNLLRVMTVLCDAEACP